MPRSRLARVSPSDCRARKFAADGSLERFRENDINRRQKTSTTGCSASSEGTAKLPRHGAFRASIIVPWSRLSRRLPCFQDASREVGLPLVH